MKVTRAVRYGLRALVEIAVHKDKNSLIKKNQIVELIDVPVYFLENILSKLSKDGLINSTTGSYGGYSLAKPASEIRISEIFICLEEDYSLIDCVLDENECNRIGICHNNKFWVKLYDHIDKVLNTVTLQNIIDEELNF